MILALPSRTADPLTNAARLAPYAVAAYDDAESIDLVEESLQQHGGQWRRWVAKHCHGLVAEVPGTTIVAIAGTDDPEDWRSNLDCQPYRLGDFRNDHNRSTVAPVNRDVLVHTGFLQAAWIVSRKIRRRWPRLADSPTLWIVGHSLGGAVASLLPVVWPSLYGRVVTYGAPRLVLWRSPAQLSPLSYASHHRFVAIDDLVPQVPFFYRHPFAIPGGAPTRILRGYGEARDQLTWWDLAWRGVRRAWNWRRPIAASRAAHSCRLYSHWLEVWR